MKKFIIFGAMAFISASSFAQTTKKVTVWDSPDHTEWHTEKVEEAEYSGHEFGFDLSNLGKTWTPEADTTSIETYELWLKRLPSSTLRTPPEADTEVSTDTIK